MSKLTCCKFVALEDNTLILFKIITVLRPSSLLRVFFMGDQDLKLEGRLRSSLRNDAQSFEPQPPFGCHSPLKNWVLPYSFMAHPIPPLIADLILEKKWSLIVFRQISRNILLVVHIFNFIITDYLKTFSGIKSLSKKHCPAE